MREDLPLVLRTYCAHFLDARSLARLSAASRAWRAAATQERLWERWCRAEWPAYPWTLGDAWHPSWRAAYAERVQTERAWLRGEPITWLRRPEDGRAFYLGATVCWHVNSEGGRAITVRGLDLRSHTTTLPVLCAGLPRDGGPCLCQVLGRFVVASPRRHIIVWDLARAAVRCGMQPPPPPLEPVLTFAGSPPWWYISDGLLHLGGQDRTRVVHRLCEGAQPRTVVFSFEPLAIVYDGERRLLGWQTGLLLVQCADCETGAVDPPVAFGEQWRAHTIEQVRWTRSWGRSASEIGVLLRRGAAVCVLIGSAPSGGGTLMPLQVLDLPTDESHLWHLVCVDERKLILNCTRILRNGLGGIHLTHAILPRRSPCRALAMDDGHIGAVSENALAIGDSLAIFCSPTSTPSPSASRAACAIL